MDERNRRLTIVWIIAIFTSIYVYFQANINAPNSPEPVNNNPNTVSEAPVNSSPALDSLKSLEVKGRAPKTGYSRANFGGDWAEVKGCDMRNIILKRDLENEFIDPTEGCKVIRGTLNDPYTAAIINFQRGEQTSDDVQIDHMVALSDAWQKGAQQFSQSLREQFANDPLNLLAVDGPTNQKKSDGDAATWLPPNKSYRCRYIARVVAVKVKYHIWVTGAEHDAMKRVLQTCPDQRLPIESSPQ